MTNFNTADDVFEDEKLDYCRGVQDLIMAAAFGSRADEGRAKDELLIKCRALSEAARFVAKNCRKTSLPDIKPLSPVMTAGELKRKLS